jgi:glutathione reductase (NADPH)
MSTSQSVDLAVIGGGSAGVRCARVAASLGARVALFDDAPLGGTCVNLGCIPKKLLAYGAHVAHEIADARAMGWQIGEVRPDWPALVARKDAEIARLNGAYERTLREAGVQIVRARAMIEGSAGALQVRASDEVWPAKNVVIATGGVPRRPTIPGVELGDVSDDFFHWPALPRSCVVVGAGYVALEIASVLAALGVDVDVLARGSVLSAFDPELRAFFAAEIRKTGIRLHEHQGDVAAVSRLGDRRVVSAAGRFEAERVVFAIGRTARVSGLGLEQVGVEVAHGAVAVDSRYATNVPGVFAIGDVTVRMELTPVALAEGTVVARNLFGKAGGTVPYDLVPTAVFSMPPVASVGLSEPTARARGIDARIFRTDFRPLKDTITGSAARTLMKVVVDGANDRVLGIHIVGTDAPEIIQGFAVALTAGVTKAQLDATLGVHPTAAEELVTLRTPAV